MSWQRLDLPGAELALAPAWLAADEADALLAHLRAVIPWRRHVVRLFGRTVDAPRLSCWIGDPGASYSYSGTRYRPQPWPPALADLRARVEAACDARFNGVLANLYRDGQDAMGWHSDDERELGRQPVIASVSLGAERAMRFRSRDPRLRRADGHLLALVLPHGSLLRMAGATQALYRHALPRSRRVTAPRVNLTFRHLD